MSEGRDIRFAKFMPTSTVSFLFLFFKEYYCTEARDNSLRQEDLLNSALPRELN